MEQRTPEGDEEGGTEGLRRRCAGIKGIGRLVRRYFRPGGCQEGVENSQNGLNVPCCAQYWRWCLHVLLLLSL